jgi:hypothetical protein
MKNQFFVLTLFMLAAALGVTGCKKNDSNILTSDIQNSTQTLPQLRVDNNTLYFEDLAQYSSVMSTLSTMNDQDILSWTRSLGFTSVADYYDQATESNCCPETEGNLEQLQQQFAGKVRFDEASGDIMPLYDMGFRNFITNLQGDFYTGKTLQKYSDDKIISIFEPTEEKIAIALSATQLTDTVRHIYVHPYLVSVAPQEIDERACPKVLLGGGSTWVNCCENGELVGNQSSPYKYKVQDAYRSVFDDSFINVTEINGQIFTVYNIQFTSKIFFHCRKRGIFGSWPTCHRTVWNFSSILNYTHNLGPAGGPSPASRNYTNITTGSECKFERLDALAGMLTPSSEIYFSRSLTVSGMNINFTTSPASGVVITGSSSNCL